MTTLLYADPVFAEHQPPPGHPESADRYWSALKALEAEDFAGLVRASGAPAADDAIRRAHPTGYFGVIEGRTPAEGYVRLDPDTYMSARSTEAARAAAGAAVAAVNAVYAGNADNAFVLARPPGHHAMPDRPMGFCLLNSLAIAALHARAAHGAQRVAVVDFDVHHGNGTEAIFWDDENAFYASSHEFPQYPGTGRASDRGAFDNICNAPLRTGSDGEEFRRVWGERLLPALSNFAPDFIFISAGFDAHRADPVGGLRLTEADFAWITAEIAAVAADKCAGRIVSALEGGYDLDALGRSVAAHVAVLMDA